jgi:TonB family protein
MFVLFPSNYCFMKFRFLPMVSASAVFFGFLVFLGSTESALAEFKERPFGGWVAPAQAIGISPAADSTEKKKSITIAEVHTLPIYPGCEAAVASSRDEGSACFNRMIMMLVSRNVEYPEKAWQNDIQGRVWVSFVIEKDGYLSKVKVERSVDPELDAEAVRVIKMMPRLEPGKVDGKPVRIRYSIPINFRLK